MVAADDQEAQWFRDRAIPMGIADPFSVLLQAHTHQAGWFFDDGGVWIGETGTLPMTPDYDANPKLMGAQRPAALGYFVVTQLNGKTDINQSGWVSLS
jgi:hypothetical protein